MSSHFSRRKFECNGGGKQADRKVLCVAVFGVGRNWSETEQAGV